VIEYPAAGGAALHGRADDRLQHVIEAGARAGLIAPDDTLRYREGVRAAQRRGVGPLGRALAHPADRSAPARSHGQIDAGSLMRHGPSERWDQPPCTAGRSSGRAIRGSGDDAADPARRSIGRGTWRWSQRSWSALIDCRASISTCDRTGARIVCRVRSARPTVPLRALGARGRPEYRKLVSSGRDQAGARPGPIDMLPDGHPLFHGERATVLPVYSITCRPARNPIGRSRQDQVLGRHPGP